LPLELDTPNQEAERDPTEVAYAEAAPLVLRPLAGSGSGGVTRQDGWGYAGLALAPLEQAGDGTEIGHGHTYTVVRTFPPSGPTQAALAMPAMAGFGGDGAYAEADGRVAPMRGVGAGEARMWVPVLPPLAGVGANYAYDYGHLELSALDGQGAEGVHHPESVVGGGALRPLRNGGTMVSGEVGRVREHVRMPDNVAGAGQGDHSLRPLGGFGAAGSFAEAFPQLPAPSGAAEGRSFFHTLIGQPLVGLAAEGNYAEGAGSLAPLAGLGLEIDMPGTFSSIIAPVWGVEGKGGAGVWSGVEAEIPVPQAEIRSGGSAMAVAAPPFEATVQAEWNGVGRMERRSPAPGLVAKGEGIGLGQSALRLAPMHGAGQGGGGAHGVLAPLRANSQAVVGGVGSLDQHAPLLDLNGEGAAVPVGAASLALQALRGGGSAVSEPLEAPAAFLRATGEEEIA